MLLRQNTLQVKGAAIIMMMMYHIWGCPQKYDAIHPIWYGNPITKALVLCVPVYLFLSGYGLQCSGSMGIKSLLLRLKKLYVNFWWVFIPFTTLGTIIGFYPPPTSLNCYMMNLGGLTYEYNAEWWFFCIYIGQLCAFLLLGRLNINWKSYLGLMILVFLISRLILKNVHMNFWIEMLLTYLNIFMLGCFFSKYDIYKLLDCFKRFNKGFVAAICVLGIYFAILLRAYSPSVGSIELISVPLFVWCTFSLAEKFQRFGGIMIFMGKHSTNLWLIHSFFIFYYLNKLTFATSNAIIMLFLVLIQALGCSIILQYIKKITFVILTKMRNEKD